MGVTHLATSWVWRAVRICVWPSTGDCSLQLLHQKDSCAKAISGAMSSLCLFRTRQLMRRWFAVWIQGLDPNSQKVFRALGNQCIWLCVWDCREFVVVALVVLVTGVSVIFFKLDGLAGAGECTEEGRLQETIPLSGNEWVRW